MHIKAAPTITGRNIDDHTNPALTTMAPASPAKRTVFLHIGMHKTASTYIQRRLSKNQGLLKRNALLCPKKREATNKLINALETKEWNPWLRWLKRACRMNCDLLISHEALSILLYKINPNEKIPIGAWLAKKIRNSGWKLKVICFIRDQESYLNSRYTQLVKRLRVCSDFSTYAKRVMGEETISQCDMMTLFSWLINKKKIKITMIPFGVNTYQHKNSDRSLDPFEQLVSETNIPKDVIKNCKTIIESKNNTQPGRLGVALSRQVSTYLTQNNPDLLRHHSKSIQDRIEQITELNGWPKEPFVGLDSSIQSEIRSRYQASNDEFCRHFWPKTTWNDLFENLRHDFGVPSKPSISEKAILETCVKQIISSSVSAKMITGSPA